MGLRTSDFHYELPEELIASRPLEERAASRMMVVHRSAVWLQPVWVAHNSSAMGVRVDP